MKTSHFFRQIARAGLCSIIACFSVVALKAQTTLEAGDIAFTGYNSFESSSATYVNEFSFVVLRAGGLAAGTTINFTDNGWNVATTAGTPGFTSNEGVIIWTADIAMPVWTQVSIRVNAAGTAILTAAPGSAVIAVSNFILSPAGDQVFAYQGALASVPVMVSGIHTNTENADGVSSLSSWDAGYATSNESRSGIPPGLTGETNAVMLVAGTGPVFDPGMDKKANWKYNCTGAVGTTVTAVRTAINNRMNWDGANAVAYNLSSFCSFAALPVITVAPVSTRACTDMDTVLKVAANYATSYQWQKKTGNVFQDLVDTLPYSGVQTARLHVGPTTYIGGYYRVKVTSPAGEVTSDSVLLLPIYRKGYWLFNTPEWSNPDNWACGFIPDSTTDVLISNIYGGPGNNPVVNVNNAICRGVFIGVNTNLSFANAASALEVKGAIQVEVSSLHMRGNLITTQGKLIYSGGPSQNILIRPYNHLEIRGEKTIPPLSLGTIEINGVLNLYNGKLFLGNNTLTIHSTGSIMNTDPNSFIVISSGIPKGKVLQEDIGVGGRTGNVLFPVGTSATSYTPITVNNSGPAKGIYLEMVDSVCTNYDITQWQPTGPAITSNVVNKAWNLIASGYIGTPAPVNATVTVQWNSADEAPGFDNQNCAIYRRVAGGWDAATPGAATGGGPYTLTRSGITDLRSAIGVGSTGSPLPLDLLAFNGSYKQGTIDLRWKTALEKNISHFELQYATDGKDFRLLADIPSKNGLDNDYSYLHLQPSTMNYYRLKIMDTDGKFRFSKIVFVSGLNEGNNGEFTIYPNPAGQQFTIWSNHDDRVDARFVLYDRIGRKVHEQILTGQETKVLLDGLLPGIYVLRICKGNTVTVHKIEKQ